MKKILITGKDSYIGTSFKRYLAAHAPDWTVDELDMRSEEWMHHSFAGYDAVFHVAALVHQKQQHHNHEELSRYMSINCDLTIQCAEKAKTEGVAQFIYLSSMSLYRQESQLDRDDTIYEWTKPHPDTIYGMSKMLGEQGIQALQSDDFAVAILRPPMVYGPDCPGNYRKLSAAAKKLPFFPEVKNQRSMLFVDNLCEFIRLLIEYNDSGIFFPQNSEYTNTSNMVKAIAKANGKDITLIPGLAWSLKLISLFSALPGKVFGNFVYDQRISQYKQNYQTCSLAESIIRTERK